jgi:hypothetical protein
MLPGTTNILDQLLGGFDPNTVGAGTAKGVSARTDGSSPLFAELMALVSQSETGVDPKAANPLNSLFPSLDRPAAQDTAPAGQTVLNPLTASLIDTAVPQNVADLSVEVPIDLQTESAVESSINRERMLPLLSAGSRFVMDALNNGGQPLESGNYQILDYQVSDGKLNLTVAALGIEAEPIVISIPADLMRGKIETLLDGAKTGTARVPLAETVARPETDIDKLLAKLNLKSLKIDTQPETPAKPSAEESTRPVKLELAAEQSGQQVVVKSRLGLQQIQVKTMSESEPRPSDKPTPGALSLSAASSKAETVQAITPIDRMMRQHNFGTAAKFAVTEKAASGGESTHRDADIFAPAGANDRTGTTAPTELSRPVLPTVKLTLPEQINKPFAVNGQSMMIKIEPEQLGPARLYLRLTDHVLTARVTVETPLARTAVENSLEQLTNQLSKAGILVDRIEVTLSDNQAQQQFMDRRPAWTTRRRPPKFDEDALTASEKIEAVRLNTILNRQYVGSQGVDLLA